MKTTSNINILGASLFVLAAVCLKACKLDAGMQFINDLNYRRLGRLVEKDIFSIVDMNLNERCPLNVAVCSSKHCRVVRRRRSARSVGGPRIDLRSVPEGYSPDAQNSSFIWNRLYELVSEDAFLRILLSGLHFSITIHISYSFTPFYGIFIPNSIHYFQRYKKNYKTNMYILYLYVRSSIYVLSKSYALKNAHSCTGHAMPDSRANVKHILRLKEMLSVINCLSCDSCKIWGKVQLHGLIAATKIHLSVDDRFLSANELICLMRLYHRLSTSIIEMKRLESFPWRCISVFVIYRAETVYLLLGIVVFWRFRSKM